MRGVAALAVACSAGDGDVEVEGLRAENVRADCLGLAGSERFEPDEPAIDAVGPRLEGCGVRAADGRPESILAIHVASDPPLRAAMGDLLVAAWLELCGGRRDEALSDHLLSRETGSPIGRGH